MSPRIAIERLVIEAASDVSSAGLTGDLESAIARELTRLRASDVGRQRPRAGSSVRGSSLGVAIAEQLAVHLNDRPGTVR